MTGALAGVPLGVCALVPGDVVVDTQGARVHAVFDIEQRGQRLIIHTAWGDRFHGVPDRIEYGVGDTVLVSR